MLAFVAFVPRAVRRDPGHAAGDRARRSRSCVLGVVWIGIAHRARVLLRDLPHGGGIVACVLVGTFAGDIGAYFGGRTFGATPLAPRVSPSKTWEGLGIGIVVGVLGVWLTGTYQDWLGGTDALLLGVGVVARRAGRRPLRELHQARRGDQGHRPHVRRARRGARPARRAAVHRRGRATGCGGPCSDEPVSLAASSSSGRPGPSGPRRSTSSSAPRTSSSSA